MFLRLYQKDCININKLHSFKIEIFGMEIFNRKLKFGVNFTYDGEGVGGNYLISTILWDWDGRVDLDKHRKEIENHLLDCFQDKLNDIGNDTYFLIDFDRIIIDSQRFADWQLVSISLKEPSRGQSKELF